MYICPPWHQLKYTLVFHYFSGHLDDSDQHYSDQLDRYEFVMYLTSTLRCTIVQIHEHFKNEKKLKYKII
jgi:hypothetical protein